MFLNSHFLRQRGDFSDQSFEDLPHKSTFQIDVQMTDKTLSDISSTRIIDLTNALLIVNKHPFKKYTIRQLEAGRFPPMNLGNLSPETLPQAISYVMQYYGSNEFGCNHLRLYRKDNSENLCRELFIASYNGLTHLSDIFEYDAKCRWRLIAELAEHILQPILPSEFILKENALVCHEIAEFIGTHVFLRCATIQVPVSQAVSDPLPSDDRPPTISSFPVLYRGALPGSTRDVLSDWDASIGYSSSLESSDDIETPRTSPFSNSPLAIGSRRGSNPLISRQRLLHAVSPPPPQGTLSLERGRRVQRSPSGYDIHSPEPLRLVSEPTDENDVLNRTLSRSSLQSVSPQPSLQRSSSSNAHRFVSTSMQRLHEAKRDENPDGEDSRQMPRRTRRHHTFVLSDSHGQILRKDIFAKNWEEFDIMFWRGVRMCDVSLMVDQDLNLYTRMPHRRMWYMPSAPSVPRTHAAPYTPYAPLYQFHVKKWHFNPLHETSRAEHHVNRVSPFYSLCADSQGVESVLSYSLPIATQMKHDYLFGNDGLDENGCKLFCAIDEPSAVFDAHVSESNTDSSFSCSSSDDFHTALVVEELRAIHPSQINNDIELAESGNEYLYFEEQIDCDNICITRCCEWNLECNRDNSDSASSCDHLFVALCYDGSQPFLIFSQSFPSVREAKEQKSRRCLNIPQLDDEKSAQLYDSNIPASISMRISKVKFDTISTPSSSSCGQNDGRLFVGVQYVNPNPNIQPHANGRPVFVPNSSRIVIYKFDTNFEMTHSHVIGEHKDPRFDLSRGIGIVFVLEDMVVTNEFVYILVSAESNPHFLGRRLSSNPWMQLPHHDDATSSSSDDHELNEIEYDDAYVSDEDEEDDSPRFRVVDNRWRVVLRSSDLKFICIEPDRVQHPGALLGCVVPIEAFDS